MAEYKRHKLDENKIYKMAKNFYDECGLKGVMSFDAYFKMIYPQIQAYVDLDDDALRKAFLKSKQIMLNRTARGVEKLKEEHRKKGKKFV